MGRGRVSVREVFNCKKKINFDKEISYAFMRTLRWRLFFDLMLKAIQLSALSCLFFKIFMTYC